jgi:hypothetical protein
MLCDFQNQAVLAFGDFDFESIENLGQFFLHKRRGNERSNEIPKAVCPIVLDSEEQKHTEN